MTVQLIYRTNDKLNGSPFDKVIRELVAKKSIAIVCPYIRIGYLEEILALCNSWRLLTDVSAWLDSYHRNPEQLPPIKKFLEKNIDYVHHYHNIHAKVIITQDGALVGSANLTDQGIRYRQEMSVLIKNPVQTEELTMWFQQLWEDSDCLDKREMESIDMYVKDYSDRKRAPTPAYNALALRFPKSISKLPKDIEEQIGNKQFYTIREITSRIAEQEETIQWDSVRRWIYYMIKHGKIYAYRFRSIQLLDIDGVKELWQSRSQIHEGRKTKSINKSKNVKELPDNQWLTIKEVALQTGKSVGKIRRMISNQIIRPKFHDKLFVFDPNVVAQIKLLPEEPSGREKNVEIIGSNKKYLCKLTKLEKFIKQAQDNNPQLSDQQLIDRARAAGVSRSHNRQMAYQARSSIAYKKEICKQLGISLDQLEKLGQLRIPS